MASPPAVVFDAGFFPVFASSFLCNEFTLINIRETFSLAVLNIPQLDTELILNVVIIPVIFPKLIRSCCAATTIQVRKVCV